MEISWSQWSRGSVLQHYLLSCTPEDINENTMSLRKPRKKLYALEVATEHRNVYSYYINTLGKTCYPNSQSRSCFLSQIFPYLYVSPIMRNCRELNLKHHCVCVQQGNAFVLITMDHRLVNNHERASLNQFPFFQCSGTAHSWCMWLQRMQIKCIIFREKGELHCYCSLLGKPKNADVSRNLPVFMERSVCFILFIILYNSICSADNNSGENQHHSPEQHFPWQDTDVEWATPYILIKTTIVIFRPFESCLPSMMGCF